MTISNFVYEILVNQTLFINFVSNVLNVSDLGVTLTNTLYTWDMVRCTLEVTISLPPEVKLNNLRFYPKLG